MNYNNLDPFRIDMEKASWWQILGAVWKAFGALSTFCGIVFGFVWKYWLRKRFREWRTIWRQVSELAVFANDLAAIKNQLGLMANQFKPEVPNSLYARIESVDAHVATAQQLTLALTDANGALYWIIDTHGRCTYISSALVAVLGRDRAQILGSEWIACVYSEDREHVLRERLAASEQGRRFSLQFRIITQDSRVLSMTCEGVPLRRPDGIISAFVGILSVLDNSSFH